MKTKRSIISAVVIICLLMSLYSCNSANPYTILNSIYETILCLISMIGFCTIYISDILIDRKETISSKSKEK